MIAGIPASTAADVDLAGRAAADALPVWAAVPHVLERRPEHAS